MMNNSSFLKYRLLQQHISLPDFDTPAQAAAWLGATQAQDYWSGKWSLGLRTRHSTQEQVETAVADRQIVRTWAMRGTLHLVATEDVHWLLQLLQPRLTQQQAPLLNGRELTEKIVSKSQQLIIRALQDTQELSREEIKTLLEKNKIRTDEQRLGLLLVRAATDKVICLGCRRGKEYTYTLLDKWIPAASPIPREEALSRLALRYFISRGPATIQDFAGWSGLTITESKTGLQIVQAKLHREVIHGQTYWMAPPTPELKTAGNNVYLLPGFDEYVLGYKDRSHFVTPEQFKRIVPGRNGIFQPTIVLNGKVAGTWKRTYKKDTVTIEINPFTAFSPAQLKSITTAARRYGQFEGLTPILPFLK
ncbi:winged helix DNA-binding domain-containing protein [Chitinophaga pendula]|uniref:winged helix DNA-binding domain-containing protein n=1 Tax=Chitinophaga TaxID=79328 RepID=UPI000BB08445|nr:MULTISPECIES: winged helix DNA-binding domain-containing protein [Chitinophaga]ASZ10369.1 hypothetical protein CK934_04925 [Chitinophaga sp. MD30]UCJ06666.1 winged helix DNA-binding domain-containing protein [Chitinophaga pendula]